jgi:transposase-like protein
LEAQSKLSELAALTPDEARDLLERLRWPEGAVCPNCGEIGNAGKLTARPGSKKPVRKGVWKCYGCLEQFTVTVGTVFEASHIALNKWLLATYLRSTASDGGDISAGIESRK